MRCLLEGAQALKPPALAQRSWRKCSTSSLSQAGPKRSGCDRRSPGPDSSRGRWTAARSRACCRRACSAVTQAISWRVVQDGGLLGASRRESISSDDRSRLERPGGPAPRMANRSGRTRFPTSARQQLSIVFRLGVVCTPPPAWSRPAPAQTASASEVRSCHPTCRPAGERRLTRPRDRATGSRPTCR